MGTQLKIRSLVESFKRCPDGCLLKGRKWRVLDHGREGFNASLSPSIVNTSKMPIYEIQQVLSHLGCAFVVFCPPGFHAH